MMLLRRTLIAVLAAACLLGLWPNTAAAHSHGSAECKQGDIAVAGREGDRAAMELVAWGVNGAVRCLFDKSELNQIGARDTVIVGGTKAITDTEAATLNVVKRLAGKDRLGTMRKVVEWADVEWAIDRSTPHEPVEFVLRNDLPDGLYGFGWLHTSTFGTTYLMPDIAEWKAEDNEFVFPRIQRYLTWGCRAGSGSELYLNAYSYDRDLDLTLHEQGDGRFIFTGAGDDHKLGGDRISAGTGWNTLRAWGSSTRSPLPTYGRDREVRATAQWLLAEQPSSLSLAVRSYNAGGKRLKEHDLKMRFDWMHDFPEAYSAIATVLKDCK